MSDNDDALVSDCCNAEGWDNANDIDFESLELCPECRESCTYVEHTNDED